MVSGWGFPQIGGGLVREWFSKDSNPYPKHSGLGIIVRKNAQMID